MTEADGTEERVPGFCALCRSRCGCITVVRDGRVAAVEPNPSHPTGAALCAKGRAAPEFVHDRKRLLHPLRRTRPKTATDPGWERISWEEALAETSRALSRIASEFGPEAVSFAVSSPSATALSDALPWIERLQRALGTPNDCYSTEICNWHKDHAHAYTFGAGISSPDFENTGCMLYWGYNPSTSWLTQATGALAARSRGAKLVVVDPRRAGLAVKADQWLRVRPGSDGALALGIAGVMIAEGWYDEAFIRRWSNGPLLVRLDTGRFLRADDLSSDGRDAYVAWDAARDKPVLYNAAAGAYDGAVDDLALFGTVPVHTDTGRVVCRPAFALYAELCASYPPEKVQETTWIPAAQVRETARLLYAHRPISYYVYTGVGQHTNATQTDRAIALLYALTGSYDVPGGNVRFARVPINDVSGEELLTDEQRAKALGLTERPLGPARDCWITSDDLYRSVLEGKPYAVKGLLAFGANLVMTHAEPNRARAALQSLDFYVQIDVFLNPTAQFADIVLPACTAWEREGLRVGFEGSQAAQELVQLRRPVVAPAGESRSDQWIVFELAERLGLAEHFWHGDIDAAYRYMLAPSGVSLETLRTHPEGVHVPLETRYRKYASGDADGGRGFRTPTGKIEVYSELFNRHGYAPLPEFVEPRMGPVHRSDLAVRYPLVLTSAKTPQFCHSQHRGIPHLRRARSWPAVEIHPKTASARGIGEGDWVAIETPAGRIQAQAHLSKALDPRVVAAEHGWWQACPELGLPGYNPYGPDGANFNLLIGNDAIDPISGSVPHRSYLCEVWQLVGGAAERVPAA